MPIDIKNLELELDAVEGKGAGRLSQETARSGRNDGRLCPYPEGINPKLKNHKERKTERAVGAKRTQVLSKETK